MGMYGTAPEEVLDGNKIAIYSQDKDLFTIPVKQWCFKKNKFIYPDPLESVTFLYTQVATGDICDGYKGCPKIGKVKAQRIVEGCKSELELLENMHKTYFNQYGKFAKQELLNQIQQARILHYTDSQLLMSHDMLYDPYMLLEVSQETIDKWESESKEFMKSISKRKVKKDE